MAGGSFQIDSPYLGFNFGLGGGIVFYCVRGIGFSLTVASILVAGTLVAIVVVGAVVVDFFSRGRHDVAVVASAADEGRDCATADQQEQCDRSQDEQSLLRRSVFAARWVDRLARSLVATTGTHDRWVGTDCCRALGRDGVIGCRRGRWDESAVDGCGQ